MREREREIVRVKERDNKSKREIIERDRER